nr:MAG TPA: hypothetical protein [Caudoviricetes sp.]
MERRRSWYRRLLVWVLGSTPKLLPINYDKGI